jgi:hypothetical protein
MNHGPLRITSPFTRINDDLQNFDQEQWRVYIKHLDKFINAEYQHPGIEDFTRDSLFTPACFQHSLVYVITETVGDYPYVRITEKTWKALVSSVPFMMIGPRYTLKKMQDLGFKTFGHWWDEGYDDLPWAAQRIQNVAQELQRLSQLSLTALENMRLEIQPVVTHNRDMLKSLINNELDTIRTILQKNA